MRIPAKRGAEPLPTQKERNDRLLTRGKVARLPTQPQSGLLAGLVALIEFLCLLRIESLQNLILLEGAFAITLIEKNQP
jgi:hypothetical protein